MTHRLWLALLPALAFAQDLPRAELSLGVWNTDMSGRIQDGPTRVDVRSDLGVESRLQFFGSLALRLSRHNKLVVEGTPFSVTGRNELNRTVIYAGREYRIRETVGSEAKLNYAFLGYQRDVLARPDGNFGFRAGVAYLDASGSITGVNSGITAAKSFTIGLPLVGVQGRATIAGPLFVDGDFVGMSLGSYGRYVQGGIAGGLQFGHIGFKVGYRAIDADIHERNATSSGLSTRISGAIFSVMIR